MLFLTSLTLGLAIAVAAEPVRVQLSAVGDNAGLVRRDGIGQR